MDWKRFIKIVWWAAASCGRVHALSRYSRFKTKNRENISAAHLGKMFVFYRCWCAVEATAIYFLRGIQHIWFGWCFPYFSLSFILIWTIIIRVEPISASLNMHKRDHLLSIHPLFDGWNILNWCLCMYLSPRNTHSTDDKVKWKITNRDATPKIMFYSLSRWISDLIDHEYQGWFICFTHTHTNTTHTQFCRFTLNTVFDSSFFIAF